MNFDENPFEQLNRLFRETSDMMWNTPMWAGTEGVQRLPAFRQHESFSVRAVEDGYLVIADLPGFEKDDLDIRFSDGLLTIRGAVEAVQDSTSDDSEQESSDDGSLQESSDDGSLPVSARMHRRQRREVYEQMRLPEAVVEEEITARYRNGVLEIKLPTEEEHDDSDTHRIDIE